MKRGLGGIDRVVEKPVSCGIGCEPVGFIENPIEFYFAFGFFDVYFRPGFILRCREGGEARECGDEKYFLQGVFHRVAKLKKWVIAVGGFCHALLPVV
ncbi:MAG TPA: hypothetical protein PLJ13_11025 [Cyclobacteriaceae bacterium]|nr:hypothetical protein [Cyclobacteriaceae bacterium]